MRLRNYEVANKDKALLLLKWRNPNKAILKVIFRANDADYMTAYRAMTKEQQQQVIDRVNNERYTDFEVAVWSVKSGETF